MMNKNCCYNFDTVRKIPHFCRIFLSPISKILFLPSFFCLSLILNYFDNVAPKCDRDFGTSSYDVFRRRTQFPRFQKMRRPNDTVQDGRGILPAESARPDSVALCISGRWFYRIARCRRVNNTCRLTIPNQTLLFAVQRSIL